MFYSGDAFNKILPKVGGWGKRYKGGEDGHIGRLSIEGGFKPCAHYGPSIDPCRTPTITVHVALK